MGAKHSHRFARLDQKGLVAVQFLKRLDYCGKGLVVSGRLAGPPVDHQALGIFGHFRVQIVQEHAQGRFLLPAFTAQQIAPGSPFQFHCRSHSL